MTLQKEKQLKFVVELHMLKFDNFKTLLLCHLEPDRFHPATDIFRRVHLTLLALILILILSLLILVVTGGTEIPVRVKENASVPN